MTRLESKLQGVGFGCLGPSVVVSILRVMEIVQKEELGHPQEPQCPDIHANVFDQVNIPSLSYFLCFHSFSLLVTPLLNRLVGVLARGQSHLTQLGTATARSEVFEAQCQKYDFRGSRIRSWEPHPPAFSEKLRKWEKTNAGKTWRKTGCLILALKHRV